MNWSHRTVLVFGMLWLSAIVCWAQTSDSSVVTLPCKAAGVNDVANGSGYVVRCVRGNDEQLFWLPKSGRAEVEIARSKSLAVFPGRQGSTYAVRTQEGKLLIVNGAVKKASYDADFGYHGLWSRDGTKFYFDAEAAKDREGFVRVGILSVGPGEIATKKLYTATEYMSMCDRTGHVFTENWHVIGGKPVFDIAQYDAYGNFVTSLKTNLQYYSANCEYATEFPPAHGPDDFGIYDARTGKQMKNFPWTETGDKDQCFEPKWNPKTPELLLMSCTTAGSKVLKARVFNVGTLKTELAEPLETSEGTGTVEWSTDGRSLLLVTGAELRVVTVPAGP